MIRQLTSGIYSYLPLGLRCIRKVAQIVREEMDRAGAQEVLLPSIQPAELWKETGRWDEYGKELFRLVDRHNRPCCLGPTHEEVITDLVRREIRSYKQLPIILYQIQTKFRDEMRPRSGVLRGREFGMKDAYSFDADEEGAEISYRKMHDTYCRIFERCGLRFTVVEADSGPIGGSYSHEFIVLAPAGEDLVVKCGNCNYAANLEKAEVRAPEELNYIPEESLDEIKRISTPGKRTVDEIKSFLNVEPDHIIKTLLYETENGVVALLIRGDHEVNETKLKNYLGVRGLSLASNETIMEVTNSPKGFAGPVGLSRLSKGRKVSIIADHAIKYIRSAVTGGNEEDIHLINVNYPRDFSVDAFGDFRMVQKGDRCPKCGNELQFERGIEVGHIFKLGTKYSEAMKALFLDENGRARPFVMGCYGIGIERTVAAAIEQNHDEDGICFPLSIAPFHVLVLSINPENAQIQQVAEEIYQQLTQEGFEVLFDDRNERPGIKFKDADLIGIPYRINVGSKGLKKGLVEIWNRKTREFEEIGRDRVVERMKEILHDKV
jgi:prolyl-tRNA synthetase